MSGAYKKFTLKTFDQDKLSSLINDVHFEQRLLQGGQFQAELEQLAMPDSRLDRGTYSLPCLGLGSVAEGLINIGINHCPKSPGWVNGLHIGVSHLQIFTEGSPIDYINVPDSAWYLFQVKREYLQQTALEVIGQELFIPQRGFKSYVLPPHVAVLFHKHLEFAFEVGQLLDHSQEQTGLVVLQRQLMQNLVEALKAGTSQTDSSLRRLCLQKERRLFILKNYIQEQLLAGISLNDLLASVGQTEPAFASASQSDTASLIHLS